MHEGGLWASADPHCHQPHQYWLGLAATELCMLIYSFITVRTQMALPSAAFALSLSINKLYFSSPMYAFLFFLLL